MGDVSNYFYPKLKTHPFMGGSYGILDKIIYLEFLTKAMLAMKAQLKFETQAILS